MADLAKDINSRFKNEWVKALINIKYTAHFLDQIGTEALKPFQISEPQYNILRILRGAGKAISVNEVRNRMIQKSPNATRLMDKLCEKKLISRVRCESDRRVVYVEITNTGRALIERINLDDFDKQMSKLTEEEARNLNQLLDKLRD